MVLFNLFVTFMVGLVVYKNMVTYYLRSAELIGILSLGSNSLLVKCLELQKKVHSGTYRYLIPKHQRDSADTVGHT